MFYYNAKMFDKWKHHTKGRKHHQQIFNFWFKRSSTQIKTRGSNKIKYCGVTFNFQHEDKIKCISTLCLSSMKLKAFQSPNFWTPVNHNKFVILKLQTKSGLNFGLAIQLQTILSRFRKAIKSITSKIILIVSGPRRQNDIDFRVKNSNNCFKMTWARLTW